MREMSRRCGGLGGAAQVRAQWLYKDARQRACWELDVCVFVIDFKEDLGWNGEMTLDDPWCLSNWASKA